MNEKEKSTSSVKRIGGYLYRIVPIMGKTGKVVSHSLVPHMVELRPRDVLQIIVGASVLAIPVGFTEEVWTLGVTLPLIKVITLSLISLLFIGAFVFLNFYRFDFKGHELEYIKRVAAIYVFSLLVVGILLTIIEKCPWGVDNLLAIKRIIIVSFPASMSATLSDTLK